MNAFLRALYRDVTCAVAAVLITVMLSAVFVEATAAAPGSRSESTRPVALLAPHGWFGQPRPAVLVD